MCCGQDGLFCNGVEFCDPTKVGQFCRPAPGAPGVVCDAQNTGGDGFTHTGTCADGPDVADSTPDCAPDADPTDCTIPGCSGGACLQTHTPVADSTPCGTDTDGLTCTTPGCVAGGICSQTHIEDCGEGRMTGGGSVFTSDGLRVTHGFELHCDIEIGPNNLEINWGPGNRFHLTELLTAVCTDEAGIEEFPPEAGFDTYVGTGTGTCNGVEGATISFTLTDAGEPGKVDFASYDILCADGSTLTVSGNLKKGNQQAHESN
jgi:hypothetical protein